MIICGISVGDAPAAVTSFTVAGPTSGIVSTTSQNFVVTPSGSYIGTFTATATGGGYSGTQVANLSWSNSSASKTFSIDPSATGTVTLSFSTSSNLSGPTTWSYSSLATISGLVAEWQFNEGSGTSTADDTGNGHTGTLSGGVTWVPGLVTDNALSFDGSTGTVTVPDSAALEFSATSSFSVTGWVYVPTIDQTTTSGYTAIVSKSHLNGVNVGYGIYMVDGGWGFGVGANWVSGSTVNTGWSHFALVQNGSSNTLNLYINGVSVASSSAAIANGTGPLTMAWDGTNGNNYLTGILDNVQIYNTAITFGQVQELYTAAPPTVIAQTPQGGASNTAISSTLTATFNKNVTSNSIVFSVKNPSGATVPGTVSYNSSTFVSTFTPTSELATSTVYTVTVSGAVAASGGAAMPVPVLWSFETSIPPMVTGFTPTASGVNFFNTGVSISTVPTATFASPINSSPLTFTLTEVGGGSVSGSVSYDSGTNTATFTPSASLPENTTYSASISGAVDASNGLSMPSPYAWTFTTSAQAPLVLVVSPASGGTDASITPSVTVWFSQSIVDYVTMANYNGTTTTNLSFVLKQGATVIPGTFVLGMTLNSVVFTPTSALSYNTTYTATIGGATNAAGDPMTAPYSWSFTTVPNSGTSAVVSTTVNSLPVPGVPAGFESAFSSLSIPGTPGKRLWWNSTSLSQAVTWLNDNTYNQSYDATNGAFPYAANPTANAALGADAVAYMMSPTINTVPESDFWGIDNGVFSPSTASNSYGWNAYLIPIIFDWCYELLTPTQVAQVISMYNNYVQLLQVRPWGGVGFVGNNYWWKYVQNEIAWAIASWGINPLAPMFLYDALVTRWQNDALPYYTGTSQYGSGLGGIPPEGIGEYAGDIYRTVPTAMVTLKNFGLDLLSQTTWFQQAMCGLIYMTSPTTVNGEYIAFPYSDDDESYGQPNFLAPGGSSPASEAGCDFGDFATMIAQEWPTSPIGALAQEWYNTVQTTTKYTSQWVQVLGSIGTTQAFSTLPVDYYAPANGFFYTRNSWSSTAMMILMQLGLGQECSHLHQDAGSWQVWMGPNQLAIEHTSYAQGFLDGTPSSYTAAHNGLLYGGVGQTSTPTVYPLVFAVESQTSFSYAGVDISGTYQSNNSDVPGNSDAGQTIREFLFVKPMNTFLIVDRMQSTSSGVPQAFLMHVLGTPTVTSNTGATFTQGSNQIWLTTVPTVSGNTYSVIDEGSVDMSADVKRIEDTISSGIQNVFVHAVTCGASGANPVAVTLTTQGNNTWTITLTSGSKTAQLVISQNFSTTGGQFGYASSGSPTLSALRSTVQSISVTSEGPVWGS